VGVFDTSKFPGEPKAEIVSATACGCAGLAANWQQSLFFLYRRGSVEHTLAADGACDALWSGNPLRGGNLLYTALVWFALKD